MFLYQVDAQKINISNNYFLHGEHMQVVLYKGYRGGRGGNSRKLGNSILTVQYCISIEHHVTEFKVIRMAQKKKSAHFKGGSELKA